MEMLHSKSDPMMQLGTACVSASSSTDDAVGHSLPMTLRHMLGDSFANFDSSNQPATLAIDGMDALSPMEFSFLHNPMDMGLGTLRNSTKTLKCPKCNWHYKYQETLEIHMKEKHSEGEVKCVFCAENRPHPKLARGESYSCGYKPYRCELCKYSTTTKGNLSIHMQSDKHLHAVQELPNNLVANMGVPSTASRSSALDNDSNFLCTVCTNYSTDSVAQLIEHAEKDRSRPGVGDISAMNGIFRCHLCPYNTNLKANFQLHTRTDKHIQRVQMINHIREGTAGSATLCRLASAKSAFQVLCKPCQEVFSSAQVFREHCETVSHRSAVRHPVFNYVCRICAYLTPHRHEALGHVSCHDQSTWFPPAELHDSCESAADDVNMTEETAYACSTCQFTTKDSSDLEEHSKTHLEGEQCPLCSERPHALTEHLTQEHKISESAVERLLAVHKQEAPVSSVQFAFRCETCPLAFRSEAALQQHSLSHVFQPQHACPACGHVEESIQDLIQHINNDHPQDSLDRKLRCELCQENFADKKQMISHLNSVQHLHKAKLQLEQQSGGVDLQQQLQTLAGLAAASPSSPSEKKPFRCNVCKLSYGQGATLDIHVRSVAHQSRMAKLGELVQNGEIDPNRPVLEQPGVQQQRPIREVVAMENESSQQNAMAMFNNLLGMAQLLQMTGGQGAGPNEEEESEEKPEITLKKTLEQNLAAIQNGEASGESVSDWQERLLKREDSDNSRSGSRPNSRDNSEPPEKRSRGENGTPVTPDAAQMAFLSMMQGGFPFMQPPGFMPGMEALFNPMMAQQMASFQAASNPAKRARTRITDDQLKVLRQYFDINNSPTEAQIQEMSRKTGLPEKVIKHWFRNTLFKERQRDKDSPYNFSVPPQMSIDLDTYEKTGETKVVSLNPVSSCQPSGSASHNSSSSSPQQAEVKKEIKEEMKEPTVSASATPSMTSLAPTPQNLAALISNIQGLQQPNPFSFMQDDKAFNSLLGHLPQMSNQTPSQQSSGRRANRTRFTDFQLRTLQQFFDKQAYPKDDDLEMLSKKLQLSPRVIVVWFQNARQKVASLLPTKARKIYENQPSDNNDRFVRTPGCNFQCKRCQIVFQRYYELIQHQQRKCYKDDSQALLNDNRGVEEGLTEEERRQLVEENQRNSVGPTASSSASSSSALPSPADLLKLLGQGRSSTEALLKMCETIRPSAQPSSGSGSVFHKRCPFCCLLFRSRQALIEHLPHKHAEQMQIVPIDVDSLPAADDVPSLSSALLGQEDRNQPSAPLDLSSAADRSGDSLSVSPYLGGSDGDDQMEDAFAALSAVSSLQMQPMSSRSPSNNKRYRTHLTPLQVHMMKMIFTDYKTPSMSECEALGREIGLHKRVVQVWFQNARAKERKNRQQNGQDDELPRGTSTECSLCVVQYTPKHTIQEHLFSNAHLMMIRALHKGDPENENKGGADENGIRSRSSSVRDHTPRKSSTPLTSAANFPFSLMNFPGLQAGSLPMLYDPSVVGTPIPLLQIPETVMAQITSDMAAGKTSTRFTQDGLTVEELVSSLDEEDGRCAAAKEVEVGWACPGCSNVFQQESYLKNHQRAICTTAEGTFTLVQVHYECTACCAQYGSQTEFKNHLDSAEHIGGRAALLPIQEPTSGTQLYEALSS